MRNKVKKTILTSFSSFFPQSTSGRFLMVRAIYPALGIILAVILFTTYLVVDDFVKATKAKATNTSPSPYLAFFDKSNKGAVLPNSKQLAQILGESDVKAADESQIIFNLNALFKAPAVFEEDITAPNIVYNITAGPGITISGNPQTPIISVNGATSAGVLSVQGLTGAVNLV
jgi:hypothetical protein